MKSKNTAAIALGRKGGLKGGPARAAALTPEQRSESARKAVLARWAKAETPPPPAPSKRKDVMRTTQEPASIDTSDKALLDLLNQLKASVDLTEIRELSNQIERIVFHKQLTNA